MVLLIVDCERDQSPALGSADVCTGVQNSRGAICTRRRRPLEQAAQKV
jgi:hypothetical protein